MAGVEPCAEMALDERSQLGLAGAGRAREMKGEIYVAEHCAVGGAEQRERDVVRPDIHEPEARPYGRNQLSTDWRVGKSHTGKGIGQSDLDACY
jgi:hypothetical protein